jgi:hypothetical protein
MAATLRRYRFTVDEYDRMAEVGLLTQCDRVELLDGDIVEMSPIGDRHAGVVARISHVLSRLDPVAIPLAGRSASCASMPRGSLWHHATGDVRAFVETGTGNDV